MTGGAQLPIEHARHKAAAAPDRLEDPPLLALAVVQHALPWDAGGDADGEGLALLRGDSQIAVEAVVAGATAPGVAHGKGMAPGRARVARFVRAVVPWLTRNAGVVDAPSVVALCAHA